MDNYYSDISKQFAAQPPVGAAGAGADLTEGHGDGTQAQAAGPRAATFGEQLRDTYRDGAQRQAILNGVKSFMLEKALMGTGDVTSLLTTSISPRFNFLRKEETPLLNLLESIPGPMLTIDDWVRRIVDRTLGTQYASDINPEQVPLSPALLQTVRTQKLQTLQFWGDPVAVSFVAQSQVGQQQPGIDLLQEEVDAELLRIRKAMNKGYWQNIEQTNYTPPNVTKLGGLISRTVTNTDNLGGADITADDMELYNDTIDQVVGSVQKFLFANRTQMGSIRTIEIARYGGNQPVAYMEWVRAMKDQIMNFSIPVDRVYEPNIGPAIPCAHDDDLPTGTAFLMAVDPRYVPRPVNFMLRGQVGPWLFVKPPLSTSYELRESVLVMHGGTIDDPAESTRQLITGTL